MSSARAQDHGEARAAELGIERVYASDGATYSYTLPADLDTPDIEIIGANTWRYVGQATFETDPAPPEGHWYRVPDVIYTGAETDPDAYFGVGVQTRLDKYGRQWILVAVDMDEFRAMKAAYNEDVASTVGLEEHVEDSTSTGVEYPEDAGEWRYVQPYYSWNFYNCVGDTSVYEVGNYSYDPLTEVSGTLNDRQKKIVILWLDNGSSPCMIS